MHPSLADLIQCPSVSGNQRCGGRLVERDQSLICEKCSTVFRLMPQGVPVLRPEANLADEGWYNENFSARSRTQDLIEDSYAGGRAIVAGYLQRENITGPSLDVGCGTGIFAEELPGFVGLDYSVTSIISPGTEGFAFVCGSAESLPFRDAVFGCVFSINALEHVPRADVAFDEIDRVLRPGGHIILKPAWHCTRYQTELLPVKPYSELKFGQKITKFMLPLLTSRPYKLATFLPWRIWRRLTAGKSARLAFTPLTPNFSQWIADSDAAASIDCHEGILFFESRGYENISHKKLLKRLIAGHDFIVLRKPMTP